MVFGDPVLAPCPLAAALDAAQREAMSVLTNTWTAFTRASRCSGAILLSKAKNKGPDAGSDVTRSCIPNFDLDKYLDAERFAHNVSFYLRRALRNYTSSPAPLHPYQTTKVQHEHEYCTVRVRVRVEALTSTGTSAEALYSTGTVQVLPNIPRFNLIQPEPKHSNE